MGLFSWLFPAAAPDLDVIPAKTACYHIEGFLTCHYFHLATEVADRLTSKQPHVKTDVSGYIKEQWYGRLKELQDEFDTRHRTSPFIYEGCDPSQQKLVGGYSEFAKKIKETYKMNLPLD
ncbi:hypothetical protein K492DRAFT_171327 [Lichtheimia hyalospora FSU 10163]|nr:hypothetical protein K492DRAFT_171327 [Lichtheimia hyalospora FSU 10163]